MSDGSLPEHEAKGPAVSTRREPKSGARRFVLFMFVGLVVGGIASLVVLRARYADPTPNIEPADYYAARDRWQANAVPNYDIEVVVTGTQGAKYRVEVRDGEARAAWRNDSPLMTQRTFVTWSVPGMFGTMSRDIEVLELHAAGKAGPTTPRLTLRAEFDPQYGYPVRYRRIEWGSPVQVSWEVTRFEVK
jgi:hypothetical protein